MPTSTPLSFANAGKMQELTANQVVTDISDFDISASKVNQHVFKFEVPEKYSSFYVKRQGSGGFPIVVHPSWQASLNKSPLAGIEISPFHSGIYLNSNLSRFPKKGGNVSPYGLALSYVSKIALRDLLILIGRRPSPLRKDDTDIGDLELDGLDATERNALIQARRGQGLYRTKLLGKWCGRCSVTGLEFMPLLRASHVKPWRSSNNIERLDVENGLLLTPNLDAAFDGGYVTFSPSGQIITSSLLSAGHAALLGIEKTMRISTVSDELADYLQHHTAYVFRTNP